MSFLSSMSSSSILSRPAPARWLLATTLVVSSAVAAAADGLIEVKSPHTAAVTMTRFEDAAKQRDRKSVV